jgi:uncharacterized protein with PIN domain
MEKYICDFCQNEISEGKRHKITFEIPPKEYEFSTHRYFDCCEQCYPKVLSVMGVKP